MHIRSVLFLIIMAILISSTSQPSKELFEINISQLDYHSVKKIKDDNQTIFWIQTEDKLYIKSTTQGVYSIENMLIENGVKISWSLLHPKVDLEKIDIINLSHSHGESDQNNYRVINISGRQSLIERKGKIPNGFNPINKNITMAIAARNSKSTKQKIQWKPTTIKMVEKIDSQLWLDNIEKLASWNRYTFSPEHEKAAAWLFEYFGNLPFFEVTKFPFSFEGKSSHNIVAKITGSTKPDDIYVIGAHFDSISEAPHFSAPGAEDNASGTAALLELARNISTKRPNSTIIFIAFSAEEQGLYGSSEWVEKLISDNISNKIKGVITMDMIGWTKDDDLDCLVETSERFEPIIDLLFNAAADFTTLRMVKTYNYWGSDHVPFIRNNIPAVLIIENDYSSYPEYHNSMDTPSNIDINQGKETLRMVMAVISEWIY